MLAVLQRNPQFRRLWLAQVVSHSGDWLNRVAVLSLIARLSGPEAAIGVGSLYGVEIAVRLSPTVLFSPLAGSLADRLPRRAIMVASDLLRALIVLGFLFVRSPEHLPWLYVLLLGQMSLAIFFESAKSAALPNTLRREDLHDGLALSAATWSLILTLGALAGGVLVELVGERGVFLADAGTYLLSALLLVRLRLPAQAKVKETFRLRDVLLYVELWRGWRHAREKGAAPALLAKTFWGPCGGFLVLLPIAAGELAGGMSVGLAVGLLYAARGIGTGLGPILARALFGSRDDALRRQVAAGFFIAAVGYSGFPLAGLGLAFVCAMVAHLGGSALWVGSTTLWQRRVEDSYRGRVTAAEYLGMTPAFGIGALLTGFLYDALGSLRETVWIVCAAVAISGTAWILVSRRSVAHRRALTLEP